MCGSINGSTSHCDLPNCACTPCASTANVHVHARLRESYPKCELSARSKSKAKESKPDAQCFCPISRLLVRFGCGVEGGSHDVACRYTALARGRVRCADCACGAAVSRQPTAVSSESSIVLKIM